MRRDVFEQKFKYASNVIDFDRVRDAQQKTLDPSSVYIGIPGTRNLIIVMEELSELSQEISKFLRGKKDLVGLTEELGDVYLALDYVKSICGISTDDLNKAMNVKIDRLENTDGVYR